MCSFTQSRDQPTWQCTGKARDSNVAPGRGAIPTASQHEWRPPRSCADTSLCLGEHAIHPSQPALIRMLAADRGGRLQPSSRCSLSRSLPALIPACLRNSRPQCSPRGNRAQRDDVLSSWPALRRACHFHWLWRERRLASFPFKFEKFDHAAEFFF